MVFVRVTKAGVAAATLVTLGKLEVSETFGVARGPISTEPKQTSRNAFTSSFAKAGDVGKRGRTSQGTSTSLWSAYVIKPDMAQSRGSEWRKLRTRGPGFGDKVFAFCRSSHGFVWLSSICFGNCIILPTTRSFLLSVRTVARIESDTPSVNEVASCTVFLP